jgi:hypothetical protein
VQWAHFFSADLGSNDDELARKADFDNGSGFKTFNGKAFDEVLNFAALFVPLMLDDLSGKDDVLEIKDGEIIIFKLFSCVSRKEIIQGPNELALFVHKDRD